MFSSQTNILIFSTYTLSPMANWSSIDADTSNASALCVRRSSISWSSRHRQTKGPPPFPFVLLILILVVLFLFILDLVRLDILFLFLFFVYTSFYFRISWLVFSFSLSIVAPSTVHTSTLARAGGPSTVPPYVPGPEESDS